MQKSTLTSQTPINKSAKIYHISDKLIGFWPCLNQDAHLISSQYFGVLKQHQCFDPTTTALAAAHGTVQHNHLSCHSPQVPGRGEAPENLGLDTSDPVSIRS